MKQTLNKVDKIPFTQIANAVLADKNLSWKAKGLFAYLYSKPDNWEFSIYRIVEDSTDALRSLLSGINELEVAGYLVRKRQNNGRMDYHISYEPNTQNAYKPCTQNANMAKRLHGKTHTVSNIELQSNTEETSNNTTAKAVVEKIPKVDRRDPNIQELWEFGLKAGLNSTKQPIQRFAIKRLLKKFSIQTLEFGISKSLEIKSLPYAPQIYNWLDFEEKLPKLRDFFNKQEAKEKQTSESHLKL